MSDILNIYEQGVCVKIKECGEWDLEGRITELFRPVLATPES